MAAQSSITTVAPRAATNLTVVQGIGIKYLIMLSHDSSHCPKSNEQFPHRKRNVTIDRSEYFRRGNGKEHPTGLEPVISFWDSDAEGSNLIIFHLYVVKLIVIRREH